MRNKSEMLEEVIGNKIGILLILEETNLDDTFPVESVHFRGTYSTIQA